MAIVIFSSIRLLGWRKIHGSPSPSLLPRASDSLPSQSMQMESFYLTLYFFRFSSHFAFSSSPFLPNLTMVLKIPPPVVPLGLCSSHHLSLSEGRAPPQISFRNRRRGGEREGKEAENEGTNEGAELQNEHEEKENGPELLEERSRTRASSAAAAAGRHREGERRCPRQAPARGVGEDPGLVGSG